MTDPFEEIEQDAYNHSMMHFARGFYKKSKLEGNSHESEKSSKTFHFLRSALSARQGSNVIDEHGNCTMCGKNVDDDE